MDENKKKPSKLMKIVGFVIGFFILMAFISAISDQADKDAVSDARDNVQGQEQGNEIPAAEKISPIVVTAEKMQGDYDANTVAADETYKNKIVVVSGVVEVIDKDLFDNPVVRLSTGKMFQELWCNFDKGDVAKMPEVKNRLASLKKGERVTFIGRAIGVPTIYVEIDNCEFYDQQ